MCDEAPQPRLRTQLGVDGCTILACKKSRLQLANPIPALGLCQIRAASKTALDLKLIKLPIIKESKCGRQSAKSPDQRELSGSDVNDRPEPRFLRKCERILGFTLHINERVPCREKIRGQVAAAVGRAIEVAHLVRRLQRAVQKITPSPDMSRPR